MKRNSTNRLSFRNGQEFALPNRDPLSGYRSFTHLECIFKANG